MEYNELKKSIQEFKAILNSHEKKLEIIVAELKEVAAKKEINVAGMKKAEIIEALTK